MKEFYYISSTKFSVAERQTKNYGKVYDIFFRVVDPATLEIRQKKMGGFQTKKLAKEAYTKFITEKCELKKGLQAKKKDPDKSDLTVGDLAPLYLNSLKNQVRESTVLERLHMINDFVLPYLKDVPMKKLDRQEIKKWQDKIWGLKGRDGKEYSYDYLRKIRLNLSAFLTWAEESYGFTPHLKEVRVPKRLTAPRRMNIWTREEFERFISVVNNPLYHCFFTMLFYTGRRRGEVIALRKENVKADRIIFDTTYTRKILTPEPYKITATKNKKIGVSYIPEPLRKELSAYEGASPFFFGGDHPIHENTLMHAFQRYILKAGVPPIRMHDLRHSFVSMLIHLGATIPTVAELIGDTQQQVVKTYSHIYADDVHTVIARIE